MVNLGYLGTSPSVADPKQPLLGFEIEGQLVCQFTE
jgi:hypothetical protein